MNIIFLFLNYNTKNQKSSILKHVLWLQSILMTQRCPGPRWAWIPGLESAESRNKSLTIRKRFSKHFWILNKETPRRLLIASNGTTVPLIAIPEGHDGIDCCNHDPRKIRGFSSLWFTKIFSNHSTRAFSSFPIFLSPTLNTKNATGNSYNNSAYYLNTVNVVLY